MVSASLSLRCTREGNRAFLAVAGEVDLATAGELEAHLVRLIDDGARYVIVDFAGVAFCDCRGLAALATAQHYLGRWSPRGWVCVVRPTTVVARLCQLADFTEIVGVYDTLAEAHAALPAPAEPPQLRASPGSAITPRSAGIAPPCGRGPRA